MRAATILIFAACAAAAEAIAPFPYVWGTAHHILPETTSDESGYFSLSEALDGTIHVGTAKYHRNGYLVAFDPASGRQRIAVDVNATCGLTATGYAAQAKIHTRNFVAPSGLVYVGSKQGYRLEGDTSEYPGGYVIVHDPATGTNRDLGMPMAGQGIADVVADEKAKQLFVVSCEDQHWLLGDLDGKKWRKLGPQLTPYATTLLGTGHCAWALTADFQVARYEPVNKSVKILPIRAEGAAFPQPGGSAIATWNLAADGTTAYLVFMNDPTLWRLELLPRADEVRATACGRLLAATGTDSRCAVSIAADGRVYVVVREDNHSGFGTGYLHHLCRYTPASAAIEDLGVLAVKNPLFFDFAPHPDGSVKPWSHGYHRLPDGTLTLLHHHLAMIVARDGTIYVTILYPFTLLRIAPDAYPR
ncbi:MAG: hypothetical protein H0W72_14950 [Planctomycetes bacterium]|nr:hypothetical protein [Planctomycetota bacterium]